MNQLNVWVFPPIFAFFLIKFLLADLNLYLKLKSDKLNNTWSFYSILIFNKSLFFYLKILIIFDSYEN